MSEARRAVRAGWGSVSIGDRVFKEIVDDERTGLLVPTLATESGERVPDGFFMEYAADVNAALVELVG